MAHRFLFVILALAAACGTDPNSPDANPYASRTYSRLSPCPARRSGLDAFLCDRGDGQTPRIVTFDECVQEVGGDPNRDLFWNSTHPQQRECTVAGGASLSTIADLWLAVHTGRP